MSRSTDHIPVRERFARQFTPDGDGFVYRKSCTGEAKKVTLAERDRLIATFTYRRQYRAAAFIAVAILVVFGIGIQGSYTAADDEVLVGGVILVGLFSVVDWIMWRAPARELKERASVATALPAEQARRVRLSRLSYSQLGWLGFVGLWLGFLISREHDARGVRDALGWTVSAGFLLFSVVQAYRKWRMEFA